MSDAPPPSEPGSTPPGPDAPPPPPSWDAPPPPPPSSGQWSPSAPPPPAPGWDPALTAPQYDPAMPPPTGDPWGQGAPVQAPAYGYGYPAQNDPRKSKMAAGLIAILIGGFGIHNFYLGYTGKAVGQLVLTLTCIGYPFSLIWSIVEGIMILTGSISTDAAGVPLKD